MQKHLSADDAGNRRKRWHYNLLEATPKVFLKPSETRVTDLRRSLSQLIETDFQNRLEDG